MHSPASFCPIAGTSGFSVSRFDILFLLICTIVGVDTIASVASRGGQAFTWMLPGLGDTWFGSAYVPTRWVYSEKWVYLLTELLPVLAFVIVGVLFWWLGRETRAEVVSRPAEVIASA